VSAPGDYDNGEIGGMIGKGNRSTRRKPAPVPLCLQQTPHAARTRTRAAALGSQRLTAELRHGLTNYKCETVSRLLQNNTQYIQTIGSCSLKSITLAVASTQKWNRLGAPRAGDV
jgi:hypothetical protein